MILNPRTYTSKYKMVITSSSRGGAIHCDCLDLEDNIQVAVVVAVDVEVVLHNQPVAAASPSVAAASPSGNIVPVEQAWVDPRVLFRPETSLQ